MEKLLVIDALSSAYRAYHALPPMVNSSGCPTGAVYGFIRMLQKVLSKYSPQAVVIAGDAPGKTFRHKIYDSYKANRPPMEEELRTQLDLIKRIVAALRIPWVEKKGYEADDIIATIARSGSREGWEVIIVSGDKDLAQLVDDRVSLASPAHEDKLIDREGVIEKFGVAPEQIGDYLALAGDSSDNIPGIPGIGPKTAAKLLNEYGDLDTILAHSDQVKGAKLQERLRDNAELAHLSRELVDLVDNVSLEMKLDDFSRRSADDSALSELYRELGFRSLLRQVSSPKVGLNEAKKIIAPEELQEVIEKIKKNEKLTFLILTPGADIFSLSPQALALGVEGEGYLVQLDNKIILQAVQNKLGPLLVDPKIGKITHNCKYAVHQLNAWGLSLEGVCFDTLLAAYLVNPSRGDYSLETLALEELGWDLGRAGDLVSPDRLPQRLGAVIQLERDFSVILKKRSQLKLLTDLEIPVSQVLAKMESQGIGLNVVALKSMSVELGNQLKDLQKQMYELAQGEFNINSPAQLRRILYEQLGLKPGKKTKTGYSTDVGELKRLASHHPLPALILKYRAFFKLKSTYIDALPELLGPDAKIHTTFHQAVTATGRLSSANPNLQNIPVRTELGRRIRKAFIPAQEGWEFLAADYSQIELRLLADLSGDSQMIQAFQAGHDIHAFTASLIFEVSPEQVTPEMRRRAKTINFGIVYGMGSNRLSRELEISRKEAQEFIEAYFNRYPGVRTYYDQVIENAKKNGYVSTIFHRRRYLPELSSKRGQERAFGERAAMNTPIQGSAADMIKGAMVDLERRFQSSDFKGNLLLQIHDELLFETPPDELDRLAELTGNCMEDVAQLKVPLVVDFKRGKNWGSMIPYRFDH